MKKILTCIMALVFIIGMGISAHAVSTVTFAWDQSTGATGYHVYKSPTNTFTKTSAKVCTSILEPTRICTVTNVPDGLMYYAATAYDAAGNESDFSDSVSYNGDTTPPVKPTNFKITITVAVP